MAPEPFSPERLRTLRQPQSQNPNPRFETDPEDDVGKEPPGFFRQNLAVILLSGALALALCFLGWSFWGRYSRMSRELDRTKLALSAANSELAKIRTDFSEASVIHELWGLGAQFASAAAGVCSAEGDRSAVRTATLQAIEMWSDSAVRAEIDLQRTLLPVLRGLKAQQMHVVGVNLPAGVLAQYRRFRREAEGHVVMLDPSRIADAESRAATVGFLRKVGEGQLDPAKTSLLYRLDDYGEISYPIVQGPADASLLQVRLWDQPHAEPATIAATGFPCS